MVGSAVGTGTGTTVGPREARCAGGGELGAGRPRCWSLRGVGEVLSLSEISERGTDEV